MDVLTFMRRRGQPVSTSDVAAALAITRQAAHKKLRALSQAGAVVTRGAGRASRWALASTDRTFRWRVKGLEEDRAWAELVAAVPALEKLAPESRRIASYAVTKMLDNVIDHSRSKTVDVRVRAKRDAVEVETVDHGVGAFETVRAKLRLATPRDAIGEISKGKTTTMPERHSGEGIFFTSKAVRRFQLDANGVSWIVDNARDDFTVTTSDVTRGTRVVLVIPRRPSRALRDVFADYTIDDAFSKTRTIVRLFALGTEFVSRSEARRMLSGLDRFREVVFDFAGVEMIGHGFADEVFRVWTNAHPKIVVSVENASDEVAFMIRRAGFRIARE